MSQFRSAILGRCVAAIVAIAPLFIPGPVRSAERLTLSYGSLARTVAITHLETLWKTGTLPAAAHELQAAIDLFDVSTTDLCMLLTEVVPVDLLELDGVLHSRIGEDLLFVVGQAIHNRPRVAPIVSLRGTLLAAADDGELSVLELLQCYPTPEVVIDLGVVLDGDWFEDNLSGVTRDFSWGGS